jgi:hypothetical protein
MSHHYSGPDFGFPREDARLDFTDLYAFPKPGEAGKSILVMNVHPSAVVNPPGPTTGDPFSPKALYELRIDTDGDAVADITFSVRFSSCLLSSPIWDRRTMPERETGLRASFTHLGFL